MRKHTLHWNTWCTVRADVVCTWETLQKKAMLTFVKITSHACETAMRRHCVGQDPDYTVQSITLIRNLTSASLAEPKLLKVAKVNF